MADRGDFFVRYITENVARWPEIVASVEAFDAGPRPAARHAVAFLRGIDVDRPRESLTRLFFADGELVGFYSLANCSVHLSGRRREELELRRSAQPGVLLTWIAKSAHHPCDGAEMVRHAVFEARRGAEHSAATLLALDPFDEATAALWREKYGFIDATGAPDPGRLPRLVLPLRPTSD